jgi:hypothetical protein
VKNANQVARIAVLPWLVMTVVGFAMNIILYNDIMPSAEMLDEPNASSWVLLSPLLVAVFNIAVSIWIIVGWHRFVLLGEVTYTFWPEWRGEINMDYFIRSFFVALVICVPIILLAVFQTKVVGRDGVIQGPFGEAAVLWWVWALFSWTLSGYLSFRISLGLPAASIGKTTFIRESWNDTKLFSREILGASFILMVAYVPSTIINFQFQDSLVLTLLGSVLASLNVLLGASVITTLYGVIKEGRELP